MMFILHPLPSWRCRWYVSFFSHWRCTSFCLLSQFNQIDNWVHHRDFFLFRSTLFRFLFAFFLFFDARLWDTNKTLVNRWQIKFISSIALRYKLIMCLIKVDWKSFQNAQYNWRCWKDASLGMSLNSISTIFCRFRHAGKLVVWWWTVITRQQLFTCCKCRIS